MPHIHTRFGEHDFCASAYIVRLDGDEPKVLLHKHKKLGSFLQFGGHVELDENPWQALRHELAEESGYSFDQLTLLQPPHVPKRLSGAKLHPTPLVLMTHDFNESHKHSDIEYVFTTTEEPAGKINADESQEVRAFTRIELNDSEAQIPQNVRETAIFILDVCLSAWETADPARYEL